MEEVSERFAGVDWANDGHSICVVDSEGSVVIELDIAETAADLVDMCRRLSRTDVRRVAIERPDGPVVDALLDTGLEVVVVASRSVKALRVRYGTSGNKSDRGDAYVLADCLRTDGHRWTSLQPDTPATVTLRTHVRARKDLIEHRVAVANQLRAHLKVVFPGTVGLFSDLDSPISLAFLRRFPSTGQAQWLSEKRLAAWLRTQGDGGRRSAADLYRHITQAPQGLMGAEGGARSTVTLAYVTLLETLDSQIKAPNRRIAELLDAHPDGHIFRSLPRINTIRAATLLAGSATAEHGSHNQKPSPPHRSHTLHPLLGQTPSRHLPVGRQQETPRRHLRLRRRHPKRKRMGPPPLPATPFRRQEPPPRRTHPRPHLDPHHLALLARPSTLRPHPTRRPPTPPIRGRLDIGLLKSEVPKMVGVPIVHLVTGNFW